MKIIGLTGAAGSGKDTTYGFAAEWCEENGLTAERVAFADPLKVSAAACFGIPANEAIEWCNWLKQPGVFVTAEALEGRKGIPGHVGSNIFSKRVSGRQLLQFYGTEAHRDVFGEHFWSDTLRATLERKEKEGVDVVFVTDTRFVNEGTLIAELGEIWSIQRELEQPVEDHASEEPLPAELIAMYINNVEEGLSSLRDLVRLVCEDRLEVGA